MAWAVMCVVAKMAGMSAMAARAAIERAGVKKLKNRIVEVSCERVSGCRLMDCVLCDAQGAAWGFPENPQRHSSGWKMR